MATQESSSSPRNRARTRVVTGILFLALVPLVSPFVTATPALACAGHQNVVGYDSTDWGTNDVWGNKADIYVNPFDYGSMNASIFRSLFVTHATGNDVEVGWAAHRGLYQNPFLYLETKTDDADTLQGEQYLTIGDTFNIKVQDSDADGIFRLYLDGNYVDETIQMGWSKGYPLTNSERYNSCDPATAHFSNIRECVSHDPCNWQSYGLLECLGNDTNNFDWVKIDYLSIG